MSRRKRIGGGAFVGLEMEILGFFWKFRRCLKEKVLTGVLATCGKMVLLKSPWASKRRTEFCFHNTPVVCPDLSLHFCNTPFLTRKLGLGHLPEAVVGDSGHLCKVCSGKHIVYIIEKQH